MLVDNPYDSSLKIIDTRKFDPNDPNQQPDFIYGPGPYFQGIDQLSFYPGVYGKLELSFEYAGWQQKVTAIETGVVVDAYMKNLPIMANNEVKIPEERREGAVIDIDVSPTSLWGTLLPLIGLMFGFPIETLKELIATFTADTINEHDPIIN